MSEPIWYYAKNDEQQGPVTPAQLKALAQSGQLQPQDLVWKEGMGDWTPAGEIKGLFAGVATPPAAPTEPSPKPPQAAAPPAASVSAPQPAVASASAVAPSKPAASLPDYRIQPDPVPAPAPSPTPAAAPSLVAAVPPAPPPAPPAPVVTSATVPALAAPSVSERVLARRSAPLAQASWPLVACGMLLLVLLRGCDSLGARYAARLQAQSESVKNSFDDEWDGKRLTIEAQREALNAKVDKTAYDDVELEKLSTELTNLNAEMKRKQDDLTRGEWRTKRIAAREAEAGHAMWSFWRHAAILPATLVLTAGLLVLASRGDSGERWLALVLLGIVAFSALVGGAAW